MKIKTSELIGPALDWAVAVATGYDGHISEGVCVIRGYDLHEELGSCFFTPSTDWAQGGPVIDRERISTVDSLTEPGSWIASLPSYAMEYGPTSLIAAMRCYVASRLGDTVDILEEP